MKRKKINSLEISIKKFSLFLFCVLFSSLSAQNSSKEKYELNDPRNPECPCHKYQKLADEEFKKLLAGVNKNNNNIEPVTISNTEADVITKSSNVSNSSKISSSTNPESGTVKHKLSINHKRKKGIKLNPKLKRALDVKHWQIFKRSRKLNSCFHWK